MTERPSFSAELKRRNVYRAAVFYAAGAWLLAQIAGLVLPAYDAQDWVLRWIIFALAVGFPFWLAFAWFYEITPEGIRRESDIEAHESITAHTGKRMDRWIIAILTLAVVLLLTNTFVWKKGAGLEGEPGRVPAPANSIAVLPFVNMSSDKEQEYFSDGISEELLNLLAKIPQLQVAARTSSFSFKGKDAPIPEIARTLLVAHVLEGSVRKAGDQVRVTAQLIRAADGYHLWSQTYDRKLDDIFAIQDEIAATVVTELKVKLLGAAPKARTTDPRAYALHLQAGQLALQKTAEAYEKSDALYRQVLEIDPRYAPAWVGLSENVISEMGIGMRSGNDGYAVAREAAGKALEIDPEFTKAHAALGRIALFEGDLAEAARQLERAMAADPTDLRVLGTAGLLVQALGRPEEAIALDRAIVRRDPVSVRAIYNLATDLHWAGQFDQAIATLRTVLSLSPNRSGTHATIAEALMLKGDAAGALAELEQEPNELWRLAGQVMALHDLGRKSESDKALAALIAAYEKEGPYNIAYVHAYRGEADKAFEWLDKAVQYGDPGLSEIVAVKLFDQVRADPRWLPFLRRIGKAPEQLAQIRFKVRLPAEWQSETASFATAAPTTEARH